MSCLEIFQKKCCLSRKVHSQNVWMIHPLSAVRLLTSVLEHPKWICARELKKINGWQQKTKNIKKEYPPPPTWNLGWVTLITFTNIHLAVFKTKTLSKDRSSLEDLNIKQFCYELLHLTWWVAFPFILCLLYFLLLLAETTEHLLYRCQ